ncbi:MAG: hypothetical protein AABW79_02690 [Nanoarchaeota archaeon]
MGYLSGLELEHAREFIEQARKVALNSSCGRSRCGSVIVSANEIIGKGFNSPPGNLHSQRRCAYDKKNYDAKVSDKSCCVHAEERAIIDALRNNPLKLNGSRLYFVRLAEKSDCVQCSGNPWCTICSKMALDVGIGQFTLVHKAGVCAYSTEEYNTLSFNYASAVKS